MKGNVYDNHGTAILKKDLILYDRAIKELMITKKGTKGIIKIYDPGKNMFVIEINEDCGFMSSHTEIIFLSKYCDVELKEPIESYRGN